MPEVVPAGPLTPLFPQEEVPVGRALYFLYQTLSVWETNP